MNLRGAGPVHLSVNKLQTWSLNESEGGGACTPVIGSCDRPSGKSQESSEFKENICK